MRHLAKSRVCAERRAKISGACKSGHTMPRREHIHMTVPQKLSATVWPAFAVKRERRYRPTAWIEGG